jgi:hypothetical protein
MKLRVFESEGLKRRMIGHLTNVKNTALNWKGSSNPHQYCIILNMVTIVAVVPVLVISDIIWFFCCSLIISFNLYFEFINGQEQKRQDKKMRLCGIVI